MAIMWHTFCGQMAHNLPRKSSPIAIPASLCVVHTKHYYLRHQWFIGNYKYRLNVHSHRWVWLLHYTFVCRGIIVVHGKTNERKLMGRCISIWIINQYIIDGNYTIMLSTMFNGLAQAKLFRICFVHLTLRECVCAIFSRNLPRFHTHFARRCKIAATNAAAAQINTQMERTSYSWQNTH